jgi:hypothetical protein
VSGEQPPTTPADLARTLRDAADRLMSGWTAALTGGAAPAAGEDHGGGTAGADAAGPGGSAVSGSGRSAGSSSPAAPSGDISGRAIGSGWPGVPGLPALSAVLGPLAPPATLSARQLQAVLDDLAARRAQVQALHAQLELFDEQLAALETNLAPVLEWTRAWAGMEQAMTNLWHPPSP